jgi:sulfur-oxidizing protein SoxY
MRRRDFLITSVRLAGGAGLGSVLGAGRAGATAAMMQEAIRQTLGTGPVVPGRVKLGIPPLVENGNTVPVTVTVDSPMTETDHVSAIHVFNEKNPQPYVIGMSLGPRAGRAVVSTRIKLADSQQVIAIAQMSDGSLWSDTVHVIVTIAACVEGNP